MRHPKPGDLVEVEFYDHVTNSKDDKPLLCRIYGKLVSLTKDAVVCDWWTNDSPTRGEPGDERETIVLTRPAVLSIRKLRYAD